MREFGATTRELLGVADWLRAGGGKMAAMESTASYWKPLFNILEVSGLDAMVVNARHMKVVLGRKGFLLPLLSFPLKAIVLHNLH